MKNKKKNRAFHLFALQTWLFPLNPNCFTLIQRYTVILKNKLLRFFPWNHALSHPPHFRRKNSNYSFSLFTKLIPLSILIHHPSSSMFSPLTLLSDVSLSLAAIPSKVVGVYFQCYGFLASAEILLISF
jgi:hypothetical protein